MAMYSLQDATLGKIKGKGYAFLRQTFKGKELYGVFFGDDEDQERFQEMIDEDSVRFEGVVYKKQRSGQVTKKVEAMWVDVKKRVSVHVGERADFEVLEVI